MKNPTCNRCLARGTLTKWMAEGEEASTLGHDTCAAITATNITETTSQICSKTNISKKIILSFQSTSVTRVSDIDQLVTQFHEDIRTRATSCAITSSCFKLNSSASRCNFRKYGNDIVAQAATESLRQSSV